MQQIQPVFIHFEASGPEIFERQVTHLAAYSPLASEGQQLFQEAANGRLAEVWTRFLQWTAQQNTNRELYLIGHNIYSFGLAQLNGNLTQSRMEPYRGRVLDIRFLATALQIRANFEVDVQTSNKALLLSLVFNRMITPVPVSEVYSFMATPSQQFPIRSLGQFIRNYGRNQIVTTPVEKQVWPVFFDLEGDGRLGHDDDVIPNILQIAAYSPLAAEERRHFCKRVAGQLNQVWQEFIQWLDEQGANHDLLMIGHNVLFYDKRVLDLNLERSGIDPFQAHWFDTVMLCRSLKIRNCRLMEVTRAHNIDQSQSRNDAHLASLLFDRLVSPRSPSEVYPLCLKNSPVITVAKFIRDASIPAPAVVPEEVIENVELAGVSAYTGPTAATPSTPYALAIHPSHTKVRFLVWNGISSVQFMEGSVSAEKDRGFKIAFASHQNMMTSTYTDWSDVLNDLVVLYEQEKWIATESHLERLHLINCRQIFEGKDEVEADDEFCCQIHFTIMTYPQKLVSGPSALPGTGSQRYELVNILEWIEKKQTNPFNRLPMTSEHIVPDEPLAIRITASIEALKRQVFPWAMPTEHPNKRIKKES